MPLAEPNQKPKTLSKPAWNRSEKGRRWMWRSNRIIRKGVECEPGVCREAQSCRRAGSGKRTGRGGGPKPWYYSFIIQQDSHFQITIWDSSVDHKNHFNGCPNILKKWNNISASHVAKLSNVLRKLLIFLWGWYTGHGLKHALCCGFQGKRWGNTKLDHWPVWRWTEERREWQAMWLRCLASNIFFKFIPF